MPSALSPVELLLHVVVFITKSKVLLCQRCHPSPVTSDSPCLFVSDELPGPTDGLMTRPQCSTKTRAEIQLLHCLQPDGALFSAAGEFKAQSYQSQTQSDRKMNRLNGFHKYDAASTCAQCAQTWTASFTAFIKSEIRVPLFMRLSHKTKARHVAFR